MTTHQELCDDFDRMAATVFAVKKQRDEFDADLTAIAELIGYDKNHPGLSLTEFIEEMGKDLEEHLCRVGQCDTLRYLITQACNRIYSGNPLGVCQTHGETLHGQTANCKEWKALQ